jgi:hypothetical protein
MSTNWKYFNPLIQPRSEMHSPRSNEVGISLEPKQVAKARRMAKKVSLTVCKSRQRSIHSNNLGDLQLINPYSNTVVCGENFDLSAEDVITFCEEVTRAEK